MGRPKQYLEGKTPLQAEAICRECGADNARLAEMLGVTRQTLYNWLKRYPELEPAVVRGREQFASVAVEKSLYRRACGYEYDEVVAEAGEDQKLRVVRKTTKHLPPAVDAIKFYLRNRDPERWPDANRTEIGGPDGGPVQVGFELAPELRELLDGIYGTREGARPLLSAPEKS
jgi:transposase